MRKPQNRARRSPTEGAAISSSSPLLLNRNPVLVLPGVPSFFSSKKSPKPRTLDEISRFFFFLISNSFKYFWILGRPNGTPPGCITSPWGWFKQHFTVYKTSAHQHNLTSTRGCWLAVIAPYCKRQRSWGLREGKGLCPRSPHAKPTYTAAGSPGQRSSTNKWGSGVTSDKGWVSGQWEPGAVFLVQAPADACQMWGKHEVKNMDIKIAWWFLKKLNREVPHDLATLFRGVQPPRPSTDERIKHKRTPPHNAIWFRPKKKRNPGMCYNLDALQNHHAKRRKPGPKVTSVWFYLYKTPRIGKSSETERRLVAA